MYLCLDQIGQEVAQPAATLGEGVDRASAITYYEDQFTVAGRDLQAEISVLHPLSAKVELAIELLIGGFEQPADIAIMLLVDAIREFSKAVRIDFAEG